MSRTINDLKSDVINNEYGNGYLDCIEKVYEIIDSRIAEINKEEYELVTSDLSSNEKKLLGLGIKRGKKELIQIMGE